jgi:hypothetical protein
MDKMLKNQIVENMQWLGDQKGKRVLIIDRLSTSKGNYNRHFTRKSSFEFMITYFGVRMSGAIGMIAGENIWFEFKTDIIKRIEKTGNKLELESFLDLKSSRLITFEILD